MARRFTSHGSIQTRRMTAFPTAKAHARSVSASGTAAAMTPIASMATVTAAQSSGVMRAPNRLRVSVMFTHAHHAGAKSTKNTSASAQSGSPCMPWATCPM